ncbi:MAG: hypothetical protein FWD71_04170 [Oscillospiraceae bacterium]|nr:hypothetical protein [Oscillospiraceae bacterium]
MSIDNLDTSKYNIAEHSAASKKYGLMMLAVLLPYYIICIVIYLLQRSYENIFATIFKSTFLLELFILMVCMFIILGVALLLKAVLLSLFSEGKSNSLKFKMIGGVQKPHFYSSEPIKIWQYRICLIVYILLAAILPYIVSLIVGDFMFVLASFIMAYWAGSDIWLLFTLFGKKGGDYIIDFDSVMFYRIYIKKKAGDKNDKVE